MEQVPAKWTADYTWNRLSLSFPGSFCQVLADGKGQTISQASVPLVKMLSAHSEPKNTAGTGKGELGLLFGVHQTEGGFFLLTPNNGLDN